MAAKKKGTAPGKKPVAQAKQAEAYLHKDKDQAARPEIGVQRDFRKRLPPATYRYDSSLSPALDWDGGNAARERGEWLLACIAEAAKLPAPHAFTPPRALIDCRGEID